MRRYARTLVVIVVLVAVSATLLAVNPISVGGFQRGGDTLLGLSLGLDLQGGSHLEYEAALEDPVTGEKVPPTADQMDALLRTIQRRVNDSGLGEPLIQQIGDDRILVQLPGVEDLERAKALIGETARLEFRHRVLDIERNIDGVSDGGAVDIRLELEPLPTAAPPATSTPETVATSTAESVATSTTESAATSTPEAMSEDEGELVPVLVIELTEEGAEVFEGVIEQMRVSVDPPRGSDISYLNYLRVAVQGSTSTLTVPYAPVALLPTGQAIQVDEEPYVERLGTSTTFKLAVWKAGLTAQDAHTLFPEGSQIEIVEVLGKLDEEIGLTGEDLERAYPGQRHGTGLPIVNVEFDSEGTRKFGELTTEIAGTPDLLAIILDDQELIAPTVREPILGGTAFIEGQDFTFDRVRDISLLLESGRLPIPITLIKEESVDRHSRGGLARQERRGGPRRTRPRAPLHGPLLPRRGRGGRHGSCNLRHAAAGHIQGAARNAAPCRHLGGHPLHRHGRRRQHPDLRAYEGRVARRSYALCQRSTSASTARGPPYATATCRPSLPAPYSSGSPTPSAPLSCRASPSRCRSA